MRHGAERFGRSNLLFFVLKSCQLRQYHINPILQTLSNLNKEELVY